MKIESIINFEYITPCKNDSCEKLCEINIPDNIQKAKKNLPINVPTWQGHAIFST